MLKKLLINLYHSPLGKILARVYNNLFTILTRPRMLWGYLNRTGEWRDKTRISNTVSFYAQKNISIKNHVYIGHYCILDGTGGIEIGSGTQISSRTAIYTHSSHIAVRLYGYHYVDIDEKDIKGLLIAPVIIGKFAYIGTNATILPGVSIGKGALVAAGSIVKDNIEDFQCVAGSPARVIGTTKEMDESYLSDPEIEKWYKEWNYHDSTT